MFRHGFPVLEHTEDNGGRWGVGKIPPPSQLFVVRTPVLLEFILLGLRANFLWKVQSSTLPAQSRWRPGVGPGDGISRPTLNVKLTMFSSSHDPSYAP